MADICMCNNPNCQIADMCFRHKATVSQYQSFMMIDKTVDTDQDCDNFWYVSSEEQLKKLNKQFED